MLDRLALPAEGQAAAKPVVMLDAGFASKANIALLKERGQGYVVNITRSSRVFYAEDFYHLLTCIRETLRSAGETRDGKAALCHQIPLQTLTIL